MKLNNAARIPAESGLMRFFRSVGLEGIAWSLRRLHCPVDGNALVLEVGSGGNPYPRANVLLDAYESTRERFWAPLKADRPTVIGFAERLPFRDNAFDFVIASHVLEHSSDPDRFLRELQRVAKAGYIETPDAFFERITPYKDHRLEIFLAEDALTIRKKPAWIVEQGTVRLFERSAKDIMGTRVFPVHPFSFHVRYYWEKRIRYVIENPDVDAAWVPLRDEESSEPPRKSIKMVIHTWLLNVFRALLSQTRRNRRIDLLKLLRCPDCSSDSLARSNDHLHCELCGANYAVNNGIPVLYATGNGENARTGPSRGAASEGAF